MATQMRSTSRTGSRGRCQFNQHNRDRELGRWMAIANLTVTRYNMPVIKF